VNPEMAVPGMRAPSDSAGDSLTQGYAAVPCSLPCTRRTTRTGWLFTATAVASRTHRALSVSVAKNIVGA